MKKIDLFSWLPAPGAAIDWLKIEGEYAFHTAMLACPQEPTFHAEGDVWTHTKMVCDSLVADTQWQQLGETDQFITFFAALLHDIGKPLTTKTENGIITSKGHSKIGAQDARIWLWKQDTDFFAREAICEIINTHQLPFFLYKKDNKELVARKISWVSNWERLFIVAKHDMLGRTYANKQSVLDDMEILQMWLEEQNLKTAPYADNYTRLKYLNNPDNIDPTYPLYQDNLGSQVIMLSGLPGSGKDSFIENYLAELKRSGVKEEDMWAVVSLDEERKKLKIKPGDDSGPAVHAATDKIKGLLRQHKNFIFNATNLNAQLRGKNLDLFHNYNARVKIVYLEKTYHNLIQSDKERATSVGPQVIENMLFKWEPPTCLEAQEIEIVLLKDQKFKKTLKQK